MSEEVLVLTTSYPRYAGDPSGHFVEAEVHELLEEGHKVRVVAAGGPRRHPTGGETFLALGGESLFRAPGALPRLRRNPLLVVPLLWSAIKTFALLQRAQEPEWICHFLLPLGPIAAQLAERRGKKLTFVGHGSDVRLLAALPSPLRRRLLALLLRSSSHFRFVSEELRGEFLRLAGDALLARTSVRPCALHIPEPLSKDECRRELGLRTAERIALVVGRLVPEKRIRTSLTALSLLEDVTTLVLGDGPLRKEFESEFPHVRFLGALPREVALQYLRASDLVVSASLLEGSPTAIREALALDTTVVARTCGDLPERTRENPSLWLVGTPLVGTRLVGTRLAGAQLTDSQPADGF